jgi:hypothetical protein
VIRRSTLIANKILVCLRQHEWSQAEAAYSAAIELHEKVGNLTFLVDSMDGLAVVKLEQNQIDAAISILDRALARLNHLQGDAAYHNLRTMIEMRRQEALHRSKRSS